MIEVTMPKWGLTMEYATMGPWRKQEGDLVTEGEVLAEVMTEKITNELESPVTGRLVRIYIAAGEEEVPVGEPLCLIQPGK